MYYNNNDVRIEEMLLPSISKNEILLKTDSCGICGTDVLEWYRIKSAPKVLGHEVTGTIAEVGEDVNGYKVGERVFVAHHVPCNECKYCLNKHQTACETLHKTNFYPGGFAEYIRVPEINVRFGVYKLPENLSFEQGVFIEPLGCILRGQRLANIRKSETLLVVGAGISGLLHIKYARYLNAKKIIAVDINEHRLKFASEFGADVVINAKDDVLSVIKKANNNNLADIIIICTGSISAVNLALKSVDKGGIILFFATPEPTIPVTIPINDYWRNEIKIMTSYGASPEDMKNALELIASRKIKVDDMITHILPLQEIGTGFKLVASAKESVKVIVKM